MRMHGSDDDVELRQDRVWQIEAAVFEDIDLDAFEDGEALERPVEPFDAEVAI